MKKAVAGKTRSGLESGFNFAAWSNVAWCFVLADVEQTARGLKEQIGAKRWQKDVLGKTLETDGAYFHPFRVSGNQWTNLVGFYDARQTSLSSELAANISRRLKTRALFAMYQDTSGQFMYLLYHNGRLIEALHWDGSDGKPRVLPDIAVLKDGWSAEVPDGFCFASTLRKIKPGALTAGNVESFFEDFLKSHGVFLVFEAAVGSKGRIVFKPSRLKAKEIERVDFVGLLDEKQAQASRQEREGAGQADEIMEESHKAYFWAYLAREEYKDMRSQRPTRSQTLKHEALFRRQLSKVRALIKSASHPNPAWLHRAALNGNLPVVELLLETGSYGEDKAALNKAAQSAMENEHEDVVQKLIAAGTDAGVRNQFKDFMTELRAKLPPGLHEALDNES